MREERVDTKEEFALVRRARSFKHAGRGLVLFFKTTPNAWIQLVLLLLAVSLGLYFHITHLEWIMLVFAGGLVLSAEAFNTAIEIDINLTSPEQHPYARDTKDVAAGAVLLASVAAASIGCLIFFPYIF